MHVLVTTVWHHLDTLTSVSRLGCDMYIVLLCGMWGVHTWVQWNVTAQNANMSMHVGADQSSTVVLPHMTIMCMHTPLLTPPHDARQRRHNSCGRNKFCNGMARGGGTRPNPATRAASVGAGGTHTTRLGEAGGAGRRANGLALNSGARRRAAR